jgi:LacI family transcriptional regulator
VGEEAAALLDRMLQGAPPPAQPTVVPVNRIITRQSTDTLAIEDELLSAAIQFIRDHRRERIRVSDILRAVPVSRRALEKGFRRLLDRSPAEEIRRARVDLAAELLCATSWPMPQIAAECGFERAELLTRAFRRELGTTPSRFRKTHQQPAVRSVDAGDLPQA